MLSDHMDVVVVALHTQNTDRTLEYVSVSVLDNKVSSCDHFGEDWCRAHRKASNL